METTLLIAGYTWGNTYMLSRMKQAWSSIILGVLTT